MAEGEDSDDKQYEPTQKRLDDARKKGEIPRSADLNTAASYGGFLIVAAAVGATSLKKLGATLAGLLDRSDTLSTRMFEGSGTPMAGGIMGEVLLAIAPWFLVPAMCVLGLLFATRAVVFAPSKLEPKMSKISMIANAKNKFGRSGFFEFFKSSTKLLIYCIVLGYYLASKIPEILVTLALEPGAIVVVLLELGVGFFLLVLIVAIMVGGVDYLFQYTEHMRKNRMSRKEMTDESKSQEGDPHVKQKRRQKGVEIAMNQMLADVPKADVIVVNPTHYAVALKWDRGSGMAPVCVAKGVDEVAAKMREIANEHGVPIHRDPPTARALHASVEIGDEIHPDHYKAVAAAIRFAETMRVRAGKKR